MATVKTRGQKREVLTKYFADKGGGCKVGYECEHCPKEKIVKCYVKYRKKGKLGAIIDEVNQNSPAGAGQDPEPEDGQQPEPQPEPKPQGGEQAVAKEKKENVKELTAKIAKLEKLLADAQSGALADPEKVRELAEKIETLEQEREQLKDELMKFRNPAPSPADRTPPAGSNPPAEPKKRSWIPTFIEPKGE